MSEISDDGAGVDLAASLKCKTKNTGAAVAAGPVIQADT